MIIFQQPVSVSSQHRAVQNQAAVSLEMKLHTKIFNSCYSCEEFVRFWPMGKQIPLINFKTKKQLNVSQIGGQPHPSNHFSVGVPK
jgi:hypothetical protein